MKYLSEELSGEELSRRRIFWRRIFSLREKKFRAKNLPAKNYPAKNVSRTYLTSLIFFISTTKEGLKKLKTLIISAVVLKNLEKTARNRVFLPFSHFEAEAGQEWYTSKFKKKSRKTVKTTVCGPNT
jgi:hypothetical protein